MTSADPLLAHLAASLVARPTDSELARSGWSLLIGGALLTELASGGLIEIPEGSHEIDGPCVSVLADITTEPLPNGALSLIRSTPRPAYALPYVLGSTLRAEILDFAALDAVRNRAEQALSEAVCFPDRAESRHVLLAALLSATDTIPRTFRPGALGRRELRTALDGLYLRVTEHGAAGPRAGRAVRATLFALSYAQSGSAASSGPGGF